jgi:hypothetical protein
MTDGERWRRADEIFDAALDLEAPQRAAYLESACAGDADLRALVDRLLGDAPAADPSLDAGAGAGPLWEQITEELDDEPSREGTVLDRYRLLRRRCVCVFTDVISDRQT